MPRNAVMLLLLLLVPGTLSARSLIREEGIFTEPKPPGSTGALTLLGVSGAGQREEAGSPDGTAETSGGEALAGKEPEDVRSFLEESRKRPILVINIPAQDYALYREGALVMKGNCRVGENRHSDFEGTDKCSKTRVGEYKITGWREKYSNKSYEAWNGDIFTWDMITDQKGAFGAHCGKLNDPAAQWVHGTYGNGLVDDFVINFNIIQGSHGCVRFTNDDISRIRELCPIGSKVVRIYATRQGGREFRNGYEYEDVVENGSFDLERGELVGYRHPRDAKGAR